MDDLETLTIAERENVVVFKEPKYTGFSPRRMQKLTEERSPKNMVNIECSHFLRTSREDSVHSHQKLEYQLWLEAGKHSPPFPTKPDENYNANIWRNFKDNFSLDLSTEGRRTSEITAASYPINLPKPSKIGEYTYSKFLRETPALIKDNRFRDIVIERTMMDKATMERLQLRSLARYPPLDRDGNIMPPQHYKRHPHYFKPISDTPTTEYLLEQIKRAPPTPYGYHPNPIIYTPKKAPAWRFRLKSTNQNAQAALAKLQHPSTKYPSEHMHINAYTPTSGQGRAAK